MSVSTVEETMPPITTMARGCATSPPWPVIPRAIGTSASTVAAAVIVTGRRRAVAPSTAALAVLTPSARS